MKKIHLTTPGLVKKIRSKNLEKDTQLKKMLFSGNNNTTNTKPNKPVQKTSSNFLRYLAAFFVLILLFLGLNIKFNLYERFSSIVLPKEQDFTNGYLNIVSTNTPVTISLNNSQIGQTPVTDYELPPGNYVFKASSKHPLIQNNVLEIPVTVVGKNLTLVQVQLGPTFRTSSYNVIYATPSINKELLVFSYKPGAKVYLNDQFIGTTPLNYKDLGALTNATIKLVQNNYTPTEIQVTFHPNTTLHIETKLHEEILKLPKNNNANN